MIKREILLEAIEKWGELAQIEMIEEECIELTLALQKLKRVRSDKQKKINNVIDEIADVSIMIAQAKIIFDEKLINERIEFKMNRVKERLKEGVL